MTDEAEIDKAIELIRSLRAEQRLRTWSKLLSKVPKNVYVDISGRQTKILHEQANTHKLPLEGERIDLRMVVKAFHDLLAANSGQLSASAEKLESARLEVELKKYKVKDAEFEAARRANQYVDRGEVSAVLGKLTFWLRNLGERLGRKHGPDIQRSINDQVEKIASELEKVT